MTRAQRKSVNNRILYIEDVPLYCENANQHYIENYKERKIEFISATCIEEAHYKLKNEKFEGIIIDLEIRHCDIQKLAQYNEEPINLTNYTPYRLSGLGIVLYMQNTLQYISMIPKLILSDFPLEHYSEYYYKLNGPKDNGHKQEEDNENLETIFSWLDKNLLL